MVRKIVKELNVILISFWIMLSLVIAGCDAGSTIVTEGGDSVSTNLDDDGNGNGNGSIYICDDNSSKKVFICHKPNGNEKGIILQLSINGAENGHLANHTHDFLLACDLTEDQMTELCPSDD